MSLKEVRANGVRYYIASRLLTSSRRVYFVNMVNAGPNAIRKSDETENLQEAEAWLEQITTLPLRATLRTDPPKKQQWIMRLPFESIEEEGPKHV